MNGERGDIGISLGELVSIKRVRRQEAKQLTVAPSEDKIRLLVKPESLKERMINHTLIEGEELLITGKIRLIPPPTISSKTPLIKTGAIKIVVLETVPQGIVVVGAGTRLTILENTPQLPTTSDQRSTKECGL